MRVLREDMLHALERVQPALSVMESVEQATCLVFLRGWVHAFNKKLYCASPLEMPFEGAVHAKPLLQQLKKMNVEEIDIEADGGCFIARFGKAKRDTFKITLQSQVNLPIDEVDEPSKWETLHESFSDALAIVQETAGKDREKYYLLTCINVRPNSLESYDGMQASKYWLATGVKKPCIVERDTLKAVVASGVEEIGETKSWLHFRGGGIRMACRREMDDYPKLKEVYEGEGETMTLPASLKEVAEQCEIFSSEEKDNNYLTLHVEGGELTITGKGSSGESTLIRDCDYRGEPLTFRLAPAIVKGLTEKGSVVHLCGKKIIIDGDGWCYVSSVIAGEEK